jgi:lipoprotein-anchoring transpeptidase ErfK/SrfK
MKKTVWALAVTAMLCAAPAMASSIVARINLSEQQMHVYVNGAQRYVWPVSTARRGYVTPVGTYRPQRLEPIWYSRKYDMSPMPHSIFFRGGYAIHGTNAVRRLGTPASHGCVRLHPSNAATLYSLVSQSRGSTTIIVTR